MNVLVISSSPRKNGNSDVLCEQFIKGASESGHQTEKIILTEKNITPCNACLLLLYGCTDENDD